jgi:hypothetical protein
VMHEDEGIRGQSLMKRLKRGLPCNG